MLSLYLAILMEFTYWFYKETTNYKKNKNENVL